MIAPDDFALFESLRLGEGLRLEPYRDSTGKLTVGYGHNLDDLGISEETATFMLGEDAERAWGDAIRAFEWFEHIPDDAQRVLVELVFNMGLRKVRGFRRMLAALSTGDLRTGAAELQDSLWFRQVGSRGPRLVAKLAYPSATAG